MPLYLIRSFLALSALFAESSASLLACFSLFHCRKSSVVIGVELFVADLCIHASQRLLQLLFVSANPMHTE
jgi:hypothetical protein